MGRSTVYKPQYASKKSEMMLLREEQPPLGFIEGTQVKKDFQLIAEPAYRK